MTGEGSGGSRGGGGGAGPLNWLRFTKNLAGKLPNRRAPPLFSDHGSATGRPTAPSVKHPFPDFGSHFTEDFQAHLTPFQVHEMHAMLRNWSDVFAQHGVGQATGVKHHFRLTDNTSFKEGSRRISPHIVEDVPSYEEMLNMRLIRHSKSPHAYNAVLVHRKDDKLII